MWDYSRMPDPESVECCFGNPNCDCNPKNWNRPGLEPIDHPTFWQKVACLFGFHDVVPHHRHAGLIMRACRRRGCNWTGR